MIDDAARKGQETVRSLRRIVGLQGQTDLHNAKAQQDKSNRTDQTENKGGQVIDNGNRVAGSKSRDRSTEDECRTHNGGAVNAEAFLTLPVIGSFSVCFSVFFLKMFILVTSVILLLYCCWFPS